MSGRSILVIDDEPQIHRFLKPALESAAYTIWRADNAAEARRVIAARMPDLILLDLGLPDRDGQELLAEIRRDYAMPIIVLSARDRDADKIAALDCGANDYIEKPFSLGELLARLRAALRINAPGFEVGGIIIVDGLELDGQALTGRLSGTTVSFTRTEFRLLEFLLRNRGRVITHSAILKAVWGNAQDREMNYLRIYIGHLRRKLGDFGEAHIKTRPGVGYYFD